MARQTANLDALPNLLTVPEAARVLSLPKSTIYEREELVEDGMLNTTEAAEWLGVSLRTLWRLMERREIPWVSIG